MADLVEITAWIIVIMIVFMIIHLPFKGTIKHPKKWDDKTLELVNGHFMQIDKRRWEAAISRKR